MSGLITGDGQLDPSAVREVHRAVVGAPTFDPNPSCSRGVTDRSVRVDSVCPDISPERSGVAEPTGKLHPPVSDRRKRRITTDSCRDPADFLGPIDGEPRRTTWKRGFLRRHFDNINP